MAYNNTTAMPELSAPVSTFDNVIETLALILNTYYTPLLVLLGCIGNVISIYVFFVSKLRMQSTSLYLSALAASDTVFLLQLLPPWLNAMSITNLFHRRGFCQVFVYSTYSSCCLSAWLVVAFTIERFVAVLYPLRRNSMCTVARAKTVIGLLVLMSMTTNLPVIKYAAPSQNDCNIDLEYVKYAARFNLADTVVSFSLPLALIVLLNMCIVYGVSRRVRTRRAHGSVQGAPGSPGHTPPPRALPPMRLQNRVTRMLLIVSWVFVILNLPAYTMRILAYYHDMSSGEYSGRWAALQTLALMFFNTNFGINFILYCLTGQNFRRELCQSIPCLRRRIRRNMNLNLCGRNIGRAGSVSASYVSATEASTSAGLERSDTPHRRHQSDPFIRRWTFDQRRATRDSGPPPAAAQPSPEYIEMPEIGQPAASNAQAVCSPDAELIERPFRFPLFPMERILATRDRRLSADRRLSSSRRLSAESEGV